MSLSVVTTLFRSSPWVAEFHRRASAAAAALTPDFEIVFVNDGSPDDSLALALGLVEADPRVRVVDLSRNFGHHKAMMTGLAHARGDLVFLVDSDLEEDPALLLRFKEEMDRSGADVVYGVQDSRKGGWFERTTGALFYTLFNWLSEVKVPRNVLTARLMTRRYVESLVAHRDREVFLLGLWTIAGYLQVPVVAAKASNGRTSYDLARRVGVLVRSVTSFSTRPLEHIFYLGLLISSSAFAGALYLLVRRLFFGVYLTGSPSLIVSVWLLGGITVLSLGTIGIYLAGIFSETKERPYTVVRAEHGRGLP
jgi:putative glycosyltransferase